LTFKMDTRNTGNANPRGLYIEIKSARILTPTNKEMAVNLPLTLPALALIPPGFSLSAVNTTIPQAVASAGLGYCTIKNDTTPVYPETDPSSGFVKELIMRNAKTIDEVKQQCAYAYTNSINTYCSKTPTVPYRKGVLLANSSGSFYDCGIFGCEAQTCPNASQTPVVTTNTATTNTAAGTNVVSVISSAGTSPSYTVAASPTTNFTPSSPSPSSSSGICSTSYDISQEGCNLYFVKGGIKELIASDNYGYDCNYSWQPKVTCADNEYATVWRDPRADTKPVYAYNLEFKSQLYFKRLDINGYALDTRYPSGIIQLTNVAGFTNHPAIAWSGTEYGIAWSDDREYHRKYPEMGSLGPLEIYFARISKSGTGLTGEKRVTYCTGGSIGSATYNIPSCWLTKLSWNAAGYYELSYDKWLSGQSTSHSVRLDINGNQLSASNPSSFIASIYKPIQNIVTKLRDWLR